MRERISLSLPVTTINLIKDRAAKENRTLSNMADTAFLSYFKKPQAKKYNPRLIDLRGVIDREAWVEWCDYRSSKKKPVSEKAAKAQILLLSKYPSAVQRQIINNSISNDYQGLFEPKGGQSGAGKQTAQERRAEYSSLLVDYEKATDF